MALQHLVQKLLDKREGKERDQIIADLEEKGLEAAAPDILSEKSRWYGRMALRSLEEKDKRSISDAEIKDTKRKSNYKLIRYSLRLFANDILKMMEKETKKARLDYLEKQNKTIEAALYLGYIDKEEEVLRSMKAKGFPIEDA
jgi:hypothetical protein